MLIRAPLHVTQGQTEGLCTGKCLDSCAISAFLKPSSRGYPVPLTDLMGEIKREVGGKSRPERNKRRGSQEKGRK